MLASSFRRIDSDLPPFPSAERERESESEMGRHVYDSVYFVFFDPSETREPCLLLLCSDCSPSLSAAAAVKAMPNGLHSTPQ